MDRTETAIESLQSARTRAAGPLSQDVMTHHERVVINTAISLLTASHNTQGVALQVLADLVAEWKPGHRPPVSVMERGDKEEYRQRRGEIRRDVVAAIASLTA